MNTTTGWTRLRGALVALGLAAGAAAGARADAITPTTPVTPPSGTVLGYDTSTSTIDSTGITGDASALKITSVAGGTFLTPSYLSLGAFQTKALDPGQSVTFTNTPFHFKFVTDSINGNPLATVDPTTKAVTNLVTPNDAGPATPLDVGGVLNGTLNGSNQSTVTATFGKFVNGAFQPYTSADAFNFSTGIYTNTLKVPTDPVPIVPFSTNNGLTTTQAFLTNNSVTSPVPEPSTVVLFAATVVGLGFRHRLRKARLEAR